MLNAVREFRREVRRLVGETGKVCRELTWYEGQSGNTTRHFYEKWHRAEIDNVIGMVANRPSARTEAASTGKTNNAQKRRLSAWRRVPGPGVQCG